MRVLKISSRADSPANPIEMRLFVLGGPILPLIFIPMVGVAPSFLIQILFVSAGSIGQAMFQPR
jgi:FSR family fosmidomycin resistance protein-like MFS transporter